MLKQSKTTDFRWMHDQAPPLSRGVRPVSKRVIWYDTKQSDNEVQVMLEHWGMRSTPSLPSLPDPLRPRVIAPDRVLSIGEMALNCIGWDGTVFFI